MNEDSVGQIFYADGFKPSTPLAPTEIPASVITSPPVNDLLSRKLGRLNASEAPTSGNNYSASVATCAADYRP